MMWTLVAQPFCTKGFLEVLVVILAGWYTVIGSRFGSCNSREFCTFEFLDRLCNP